ncbi:katanin p60 ATPase-containing subunit A-like 2 [Anopheles ziemanni]|uniref:katanin p60 ATPase-containing subunit A-like 2 n=1 Tax=Anopheles coustani TaxID=139045 RepID=UPI00265AF46B|nr:katanin p60 ATPase-containing subunit A-like 2 [Anopheles coustani]XP_058173708.1 katanin p60 ATPase-containing subunit A-like 2 [Anopheles ziemanni]
MSFEQDRRSIYERRRNILYLVANYLSSMGLHQTRQMLIDETHLTSEYEVCDNIDLDTIYQDFCSYFLLKFGKQPRIVKRTESVGLLPSVQRKYSGARRKTPAPIGLKPDGKDPLLSLTSTGEELQNMLRVIPGNQAHATEPAEGHPAVPAANPKLLVRLQDHFTSEWKDLAEEVCRDLIRKDLRQRWESIKGLPGPIKVLKESVIAPLEHPELFVGLAQPWRCVLLHGAPGTGKTLLARTLCSETRESVTFFSTTASTLISKWRGESEKLIRILYEVAKFYAPSIIFIDEFDSLASRRDTIREHEASKRFKNEFLSLIDGLESAAANEANGGEGRERVFLLASTNLPWEIDPAFLRRFERKILVDLPTADGRKELIEHLLPTVKSWPEQEIQQIITLSEGWTGDEVRLACKEASMMLLRDKLNDRRPVGSGKLEREEELHFPMLCKAFEQQRPGCVELAQKHREWNQRYGTQLFD